MTNGPRAEYARRIDKWDQAIARGDRTHMIISNVRIVLAVAIAVLAWQAFVSNRVSAAWPILLVAVFAVLVVVHARALLRIERIKLAAGAHLLPYHDPAELAAGVAFMDHIAKGRLMFGVGAGGLPSDWAQFNVDGMNGENRLMTREALDIILKLWTCDEPFE